MKLSDGRVNVDYIGSLPSRECGLKYDGEKVADDAHVVTPFAGVWIEIVKAILSAQDRGVTPFAGVWIEIK